MAAAPESGFLVIADLTGYTSYLSRGEIEHAPAIAGDLLETVVGRLEPPFRLAKLEGDAAFLYVEDGRAESSLLMDAIEACYAAFRRRLRSIEQGSACDCNACSQAPRLDLKFFVHHGQYVRSRIAGRDELAGSSIIVVHRLLKGAARTAIAGDPAAAQGFALFTGAAIEALGVDPEALALVAGSESIEHLGDVATWTLDLEAGWSSERGLRRLDLADAPVAVDLETGIDAPAADVWAHLTAPSLRPTWEGPLAIEETGGPARRGSGTQSVCVTGRLATLEEIIDWQPYEHVGYRLTVPGIGPVDATYDLRADDDATTVRLRWAPAGSGTVPIEELEQIRTDKLAALERLARRLGAANRLEEVPA